MRVLSLLFIPLIISCVYRFDAVFVFEETLINSEGMPYVYSKRLLEEYIIDDKKVLIVVKNRENNEKICNTFGVEKENIVETTATKALRKYNPKTLYSGRKGDLTGASNPVYVYTGENYASDKELLNLETDEGAKVLIQYEARNKKISLSKDKIKIIDGDTIKYDNMSYRFLGVDAPEIGEGVLGQREGEMVKIFVSNSISLAKEVSVCVAEKDRYNRVLAHVFVDGESLSLMLIKNKMAEQTITYYGDNGFYTLAREIEERAKGQRLPFQNPYEFRKSLRKEQEIKRAKEMGYTLP